jgi:hypothetical protein
VDIHGVGKAVAGLLLEAFEAETASVLVYEAALMCVRAPQAKHEWEWQRMQCSRHADVAESLIRALGLDPDDPTPGRLAVRDKGIAFVDAILSVHAEAPELAEVVAAECIVDAERKCERCWQLIAEVATRMDGEVPGALMRAARAAVVDEGRAHVEQSSMRCRELWMEQLGLRASRGARFGVPATH